MEVQIIDENGEEVMLDKVRVVFIRGKELKIRRCIEYECGEYVDEDVMISRKED